MISSSSAVIEPFFFSFFFQFRSYCKRLMTGISNISLNGGRKMTLRIVGFMARIYL